MRVYLLHYCVYFYTFISLNPAVNGFLPAVSGFLPPVIGFVYIFNDLRQL